jgi:hypothetical protein
LGSTNTEVVSGTDAYISFIASAYWENGQIESIGDGDAFSIAEQP